ncbi:MAG: hypothetical protein ACK587_00155 [Cyanobacteriota bacterium]
MPQSCYKWRVSLRDLQQLASYAAKGCRAELLRTAETLLEGLQADQEAVARLQHGSQLLQLSGNEIIARDCFFLTGSEKLSDLMQNRINSAEDAMEKRVIGKVAYTRQGRFIIFVSLAAVVFFGVIVVAILTSLIGKSGGEQLPKVYFLLIASILGALVNQPFRDAEGDGNKGPSVLALYLAWKCAIASVFAIMVNLIFISGVISGELFPQFNGANWSYIDMISWALDIDPKTNADMAKMLIWSFVAGFSEKLVPNMVTKIFVMPE